MSYTTRVLSLIISDHPLNANGHHTGATEADLVAMVRHKYSTLRRLVIRPASPATGAADRGASAAVIEAHFAGPQPSTGCGALLCSLLGGESVEAWPIDLPRGRPGRKTQEAAVSEGENSQKPK